MNQLKKIIQDAFQNSISAHNTQPFSFKLSDTVLTVSAIKDRLLLIADHNNKDFKVSFGCFLESLSITCTNYDISYDYKEIAVHNWQITFTDKSQALHPYFDILKKRFSFRAPFEKQSAEFITSNVNIVLLKKENHKTIATLFDETNIFCLKQKNYVDELYLWLRFNEQDPLWSIDGLNTDSLGFNFIESIGAKTIMRPKIFSILKKIGLIPILLSEASKVENSPYIVAFLAHRDSNEIECGKLFLRYWLELTEKNIYGHPLSVLVDFEKSLNECQFLFNVPPGKKIINILRCGQLPKNYVPPLKARRSIIEDL